MSPLCILQRWELVEPLIRQQDMCLAITAFTAGSKVKMEPCNTKEPKQVRENEIKKPTKNLYVLIVMIFQGP